MSDKPEKKPDAAAKDAGDKKPAAAEKKAAAGGLLTKLPVLLGGVMLIEAVVLFAGFKFLGGGAPHASQGAEISAEEHGEGKKGEGEKGEHGPVDKKKIVEIQVLDF